MGSNNQTAGQFSWRWIVLSLSLLVIYLGFFHWCLDQSQIACRIAGFVFWLVWVVVTIACRRCFLNRFEFWIHQLVGMDILLEGFNPLHEGYGFYGCALAFWAVLLFNHVWTAIRLGTARATHAENWLTGSQTGDLV